jgi:hypothetical protein
MTIQAEKNDIQVSQVPRVPYCRDRLLTRSAPQPSRLRITKNPNPPVPRTPGDMGPWGSTFVSLFEQPSRSQLIFLT